MAAAIGAATHLARHRRLARARARTTPGAYPARRDRGQPAPAAPRRRPWAHCARGCGSRHLARRRRCRVRPPYGLRVEILDVGQGDAILLQPASAPAVLVDGGPPGDELRSKLVAAGVERLGAAVVTHDEADHAGGVDELLDELPVTRLLYAAARPSSPPRRAPLVPDRSASPAVTSCASALCGWKCCGRHRSSPPRRHPEPTRTRWRWSCSPAGAISRCCSAPTPRPRRCRSTPVRSTFSRLPTMAPTTPAWASCSSGPDRGWRLSRSAPATPSGTQHPAPWRPSPDAGVPTLRTDLAGQSIDVRPGSAVVRSR